MSAGLRRRAAALAMCAFALCAWVVWPVDAQAPTKRPLTYDAYDYWRSIQGTRLSDDGAWLAYALTSQGEDGELIVRNVQSGQELKHPRGTSPTFTPDGKFVIFTIVPPKADANDDDENEAGGATGRGGRGGAGTGAGNAVARNSVGIMALPGGTVTTVEQISNFRLPENASTWVAMHKGRAGGGGRGGRGGRGGGRAGGGGRQGGGEPAAEGTQTGASGEKRKDPGNDLIVRNLATGQDTTIADVVEYAWDKTGTWLAYATSSTDAAKDGAFARRMSDGTTRTLKGGRGHYKGLAFDEAGQQVAFLSDQPEYEKPVAPYRLYYWRTSDAGEATELVSASTRGIAEGMVVSDNFTPRFSEDGKQLYLGVALPPPAPAAEGAKAPLRVDIWSSRDPMIQPMQQVRATQERNRNYRAVVHLPEKRYVQLATRDLPNVNPGNDPNRALGTNDLPYQQEISWDTSYNDTYLVDLKNGQRRKLLEHFNGPVSLSPSGHYVLYFDEKEADWFTYRIADGTRTNLTAALPVKFFDESHDTPDLPGSYGSAGWTEGDRSVLLYDQYDIWELKAEGREPPRMITNGDGRKQHLVFRYRTLNPEQRAIPTSAPLLLATTNDDTKATGYYRVNYAAGSTPEKIIMMDKAMGAPIKAKNASTVVFTQQRFDEFPDLWLSDTSFAAPKKVSNANPQQSEFVWGKAENITYINSDGKELKAMLIKPENFDPTKKYPMMVYIYEQLSQGLHSYRAPNVGTSVNLSRYVSNGYVVLQPDIVYETGYPGPSAMKCVIPAIQTVMAQGYIDPKRIGIQGHSWGGYQITYMITQTNMFAAVEAGASVTNMTSAYGGIRWGTGMVRQFQYEKTQSRIGASPWDAPLQFIENSPLFWIERINTPYLTIHNDADDAVPWYQGIEFNTAMRRLGKEAYMFTYNGERHGLSNRDNMKHWTVHMDEFFDHYLLGKPRPAWMDKGVPYLDRGTRDVSGMFKRATTPSPSGGGKH
ncbi:MAG TPA: prolyl oligopeptidase family serine peptidase [Vicinamibacterales bacterium]|nr:prolyl oligopeptidase family serine peptidase [Vicinamibacterales bacterium]